MYDTVAEFQQKLSSCVVLLNDVPTYIIDAGGVKKDIILLCKNLRTGTRIDVKADDPGWDFRTVGSRLGYTNLDFGADSYRQSLYLSRAAIRQSSNTQGLSARNVKFDPLKPVLRLGLGPYRPTWNDIYNKAYFCDTLERKYPSYQDVCSTMAKEKDVTSWAFSPKFSVLRPDVGPFYLEYRGKSVGYSDDLYRWRLGENFEHLRESLEHVSLKVA